jgi:hypothetical protein
MHTVKLTQREGDRPSKRRPSHLFARQLAGQSNNPSADKFVAVGATVVWCERTTQAAQVI